MGTFRTYFDQRLVSIVVQINQHGDRTYTITHRFALSLWLLEKEQEITQNLGITHDNLSTIILQLEAESVIKLKITDS
jgi:hypothetical protein